MGNKNDKGETVMAVIAFTVLIIWCFLVGAFVYSLCRVASYADDLAESWEKARKENEEKQIP